MEERASPSTYPPIDCDSIDFRTSQLLFASHGLTQLKGQIAITPAAGR